MKKIIILFNLFMLTSCSTNLIKYSKINERSDHYFDQYYYEWLNNHYFQKEKPEIQISANFGNIEYYGMCISRDNKNESEIIVNKRKFENISQEQKNNVMFKLYSRCYFPDYNNPYEYIVDSL